MLLLFLCVLCLCGIKGEINVRCGSGNGSFVEAEDGVAGRYRLELCTVLKHSMVDFNVQWDVSLRYNSDERREDCRYYRFNYSGWERHSQFTEDVSINLNCTNVCLSTNLDLIFNSTCYAFKTHLKVKNSYGIYRDGFADFVSYVTNNYTKDDFSKSETVVAIYPSNDHVEAHWYLHRIPATKYTVKLCPEVEPNMFPECVDVTPNCTPYSWQPTRLRCSLWPPPEPYSLRLDHQAPWTINMGLFANISSVTLLPNSSVYISATAPPAVIPPPNNMPWFVVGGVVALAVTSLAALAVCRLRLMNKLRERVQADWRNRRQVESVSKPAGRPGSGIQVLLLYARDCALMMDVAAELRRLLLRLVDNVYDLYSPETVRAAARAPADWLRRLAARADVRVLLLQSPAAALLLPAARGPHLTSEQPLLGRRAVYRAPHSSDNLLPLSLRLMTDTAHTTQSYKKFYISQIAELETEIVGDVTPHRRYILPAATTLLLDDISDGGLTPTSPHTTVDWLEEGLGKFEDTIVRLHEHVRANPDYLDDELLFFDE